MRDGNAKTHTSDRGDANRKRNERDRMRDEGFVLVQHWVHKGDLARARKYLKRMKDARLGEEPDE